MLFMVIEHFRGGDSVPVYARFRARGRLAPAGLNYVASWVTADRTRCFQVMETADQHLLERWMDQWSDLIEFDVMPVITSADAASSPIAPA
jgi:Domain of unknown function (DUF3303)